MVDWSELTAFIYVTARVSGFILFNPMLGRRNIPGIFRAGMVLVLSIFVMSVSTPTVQEPSVLLELCVHVLMELFLGFLLGMVVNFFFYIPQLSGQVIDTQMGMTMNQIYDSGSQANMSVTSALLNALMILLFFAANGHHTMLRILLTSEELVPYGEVQIGTEVLDSMLQLFIECTLLAVKLCLPILAAEMIGQLGMGILMKVIPQINVFSINIELKVMIGLALMFLLIHPFSEFLLQAEMTMLDSIQEILALAASA
jgi:flagellar biosynthetic protein FliR